MMKMWKKLIMSAFVCMVLFVTAGVHAAEAGSLHAYVFDYAGLLEDSEMEDLQEQIEELREETGWDIFAVTTNDAEGKNSTEYADDFYDALTEEDSSGFLVLIDMDNREIYITNDGETERYLTDERIEDILDEGYYYVSDGEYAECLSAMISTAEYYYREGIEEDQYTYDVDTGEISEYRVLTFSEVIGSLLLGAGVGLLIYFMVARRYSLKGTTAYEYPYTKYGNLELTGQEDHFIRQHITHQRIQTNTSSGGSHGGSYSGRSTVHHSSSGRTHGGGGRKF